MRRLLVALALLFGLVAADAATAQLVDPTMAITGGAGAAEEEAPAATGQPTPADLRELARLLADPRIAVWIEEKIAEVETPPDQDATDFGQSWAAILTELEARAGAVGQAATLIPTLPLQVLAVWSEKLDYAIAINSMNGVIIFLFVGAALEWLYWRYAIWGVRRVQLARADRFASAVAAAFGRLAVFALGAFCFAAGAVGGTLLFDFNEEYRSLVFPVLGAAIALRFVFVLSRFVFAPWADHLRLVPLSRASARRAHRYAIGAAAVSAAQLVVSESMQILEAPAALILALQIFNGAVIATMAIVLVWVGHSLAQNNERAPEERAGGMGLKAWKPALITVGVVIVYVLWLVADEEVSATALVLMLIPATVRGAVAVIGYAFDRVAADRRAEREAARQAEAAAIAARAEPSDDDASEDAPIMAAHEGDEREEESATELYRPITLRLARFAIVIAGFFTIASLWGVSLAELAASGEGFGRAFIVLVDVVVALLIGDLVWIATKTAIDRRMAKMPKLVHGQAPGPEARMATLLPLFKKIVAVTVAIMVGLIALSSLGVNIGPILAGAGVLGLAIGFGAQALVRDIVSGVFFLIDDAFRVGEYIEMGELRGTVEAISIRSLRVRHHRGALHTIPFGELKSLTNYSRDWVMMKLEFRVPFEADLKQAKKIVKRIGAEMLENPDYGDSFLEPLKFQGVRRMEEFNMVVGVKFMTKPGEQWTIRRDVYQRVRDEFDKAGIRLAERNVKVEVIGAPDQATAERAAAAAQDAIEQQAGASAPA